MTPLLLLPGIEGDRRIWEPVMSRSGERECAVMDLPGPVGGLQEMAANLLSHLEWDQFFLAGLSIGGLVGRAIAEQAPERVKGLVMVGSLPDRTLLPRSIRVSSVALGCVPERLLSRLYRRRIRRILQQEGIQVDDYDSWESTLPPKDLYLQRLRAVSAWGLRESIDVPALLLRGREEREAPWSLDEARMRLPQVLVEETPGGHRCVWTHPEECWERINRFLQPLEGPR